MESESERAGARASRSTRTRLKYSRIVSTWQEPICDINFLIKAVMWNVANEQRAMSNEEEKCNNSCKRGSTLQLSAIDEHAGAVASASHSHVSSRFQFRLISGLVIAQFRKACPGGCLDARDVVEGERQLASRAKRRRMGLRTYGRMRLITMKDH